MPAIQNGTTFNIFDSAIVTHDALPVGTYRVSFNPMAGHSLTKVADIMPVTETMYGSGKERIKRVMRGFERMNRSYGVLMSGSGGMGKTMLARHLLSEMQKEHNLPVILIEQHSPGLPQFLESLGACVLYFDEFEKNFSDQFEDATQSQFLPLFDGLDRTKRMSVVVVNELHEVSKFIVNRTGRFHAHLRFDFPTADEIREFLTDNGVSDEDDVNKCIEFSRQTHLNYDHLRAIAFELAEVGGTFDEAIADLNIKNLNQAGGYLATAVGSKGTLTETVARSHFNQGIFQWDEGRVTWDRSKVKFDGERLYINASDTKIEKWDDDTTLESIVGDFQKIEFELQPEASYAF